MTCTCRTEPLKGHQERQLLELYRDAYGAEAPPGFATRTITDPDCPVHGYDTKGRTFFDKQCELLTIADGHLVELPTTCARCKGRNLSFIGELLVALIAGQGDAAPVWCADCDRIGGAAVTVREPASFPTPEEAYEIAAAYRPPPESDPDLS